MTDHHSPFRLKVNQDILLAMFFVFTLLAWIIWIPQATVKLGYSGSAVTLSSPLNMITVWMPTLGAILISFLSSGGPGIRKLFGGLRKWRVGVQWYLLVCLLEPGRWLMAFALDHLLGNEYALSLPPLLSLFGSSERFLIPMALVLTLPNALGEELGWRGYALPGLLKRFSPFFSTLFLGIFWATWHLPAWVGQMPAPSAEVLVLRFINIVGLAFIFTWIYIASEGSLTLVIVLHAATAVGGYLLPPLPSLTGDIILWVLALGAGFLIRRDFDIDICESQVS
jgi:membrane protease YdiL (CAAX protease family)